MFENLLQSLGWVGTAVALVVLFLVIELVMRAVTNRYAGQRGPYVHRQATEYPRTPA